MLTCHHRGVEDTTRAGDLPKRTEIAAALNLSGLAFLEQILHPLHPKCGLIRNL